jgi:hypothetical protein
VAQEADRVACTIEQLGRHLAAASLEQIDTWAERGVLSAATLTELMVEM